jgi:hypothetical protein
MKDLTTIQYLTAAILSTSFKTFSTASTPQSVAENPKIFGKRPW